MRLFTSERYLRLDFLERSVENIERRPLGDGNASIEIQPVAVRDAEPLRLQLQSFVDAVTHKSPPRVSAERALRALELAAAIRNQIDERRLRDTTQAAQRT
jgi:predicted dehydrogenase